MGYWASKADISHFFKPYKTMKEVYTWSTPKNEYAETSILNVWWTLFIIDIFLSRFVMRMSESLLYNYTYLFSYLLDGMLFWVELKIVLRISTWQMNLLNSNLHTMNDGDTTEMMLNTEIG